MKRINVLILVIALGVLATLFTGCTGEDSSQVRSNGGQFEVEYSQQLEDVGGRSRVYIIKDRVSGKRFLIYRDGTGSAITTLDYY